MIIEYPPATWNSMADWAKMYVGVNIPVNLYASNGRAYLLATDAKVRYLTGDSVLKTFSPGGNRTSRFDCPLAHRDWIYYPTAGRSGQYLTINLTAYNPVKNTSVTILSASAALSYTISSSTTCLGFGDVSIDPITGIGLCCMGVSFTGIECHYVGGPVQDEVCSEFYGTYYRLFTFTAGTQTTNPAYKSAIVTVNSSAAADRKLGYGLVGAYNNMGLVYDCVAASVTYKPISALSTTPTMGAAIRSGASSRSLITGPMLFMDYGSPTILRDRAGNTWTLTYRGTTGNWFDVIGSDSTYWYLWHCWGTTYAAGPGSAGYEVCKIEKAPAGGVGTVQTIAVSEFTSSGADYYKWDYYPYAGKQEFYEQTYTWPFPRAFLGRTGVQGYMFRIPLSEVS